MSLGRLFRGLIWALSLSILASCAGRVPLDTAGVDESLTVNQAAADPEGVKGRKVEWGGVVISSTNLKDATQIEVLSYPLDSGGKPDVSAAPLGRFLALRAGYLETAVFAPGRVVTLVGPVAGARLGKIGETEYSYPTVSAEQIHLWPVQQPYTEPRVHLGFGFGIIR
ncbi:MAG: Slp family lipoprotein [Deltaproteobacteria bacterium]|nr:Slp family lipoprotein [Deltaproteobacteria bacterium]